MKNTILTTFIATIILFNSAQPKSITKEHIDSYQTKLIAKMIGVLQPELKETTKNRIAKSLYKTTRKYKVDPKLMIAIIGTESDFVNGKPIHLHSFGRSSPTRQPRNGSA